MFNYGINSFSSSLWLMFRFISFWLLSFDTSCPLRRYRHRTEVWPWASEGICSHSDRHGPGSWAPHWDLPAQHLHSGWERQQSQIWEPALWVWVPASGKRPWISVSATPELVTLHRQSCVDFPYLPFIVGSFKNQNLYWPCAAGTLECVVIQPHLVRKVQNDTRQCKTKQCKTINDSAK